LAPARSRPPLPVPECVPAVAPAERARSARRSRLRAAAWFRRAACGAIVAIAVAGCTSSRERTARTAWDALDASFDPPDADAAPLTSQSTLDDYVRVALSRNPGLRAQAQRWRADLERVPQAWAIPEPRLSYGGFLEPIETRIGPQRHTVAAAQRIPWPGKLSAAADVALEHAGVSEAHTETVRRRVVAEVTRAFADYWELRRELAITRDTLALVQHWESVAQVRLRAGGKAAHRDVIKAQVEIGRLEDRQASLEDARRVRVRRLAALLDLPPSAELPWPSALPERRLERADQEVLALLAERSPLLAELSAKVALGERAVERARQAYFPDFMVGVTHVNVGHARASGVSHSGDDAWVLNVGLDLPVWIGRYAAQVSEAEARLRAAELEREAADTGLAAEVTRALFDYRDAERKLSLYRDTLVPKAEESLRATAAAYETGAGDFLDLLDAERVLLDFHLARERALADRLTSLAELELLTGSELSQRPADQE